MHRRVTTLSRNTFLPRFLRYGSMNAFYLGRIVRRSNEQNMFLVVAQREMNFVIRKLSLSFCMRATRPILMRIHYLRDFHDTCRCKWYAHRIQAQYTSDRARMQLSQRDYRIISGETICFRNFFSYTDSRKILTTETRLQSKRHPRRQSVQMWWFLSVLFDDWQRTVFTRM